MTLASPECLELKCRRKSGIRPNDKSQTLHRIPESEFLEIIFLLSFLLLLPCANGGVRVAEVIAVAEEDAEEEAAVGINSFAGV